MTVPQFLLPFKITESYFLKLSLSLVYHISPLVFDSDYIFGMRVKRNTIRIVSFSVYHMERQFCFPIICDL